MKDENKSMKQAVEAWHSMTPDEMQSKGYLVIFWTPEELSGIEGWSDAVVIRDLAIIAGNEAINNLRSTPLVQ
jgi:hypothetical protein